MARKLQPTYLFILNITPELVDPGLNHLIGLVFEGMESLQCAVIEAVGARLPEVKAARTRTCW